MSQPATKPTAAPAVASAPASKAAPTAPAPRKLKKGELLFAEGETSRAMYFVKSGIIRIFKRKGESLIEIDTIRSGSVLGELAFLDGNPRSASGEALTDCELVEISGPAFQETLAKMPDWLKILLKTIVTRLRAASNRIRQLESASVALEYGKDGKSSSKYVYISTTDALKIASAILLVGARNGKEATSGGLTLRPVLLQRYANQVMGVPVAKVTTFVDLLTSNGVIHVEDDGTTVLKDIDFVEQMISYINEENLLEESKRHTLTIRGFYIMSLIAKYAAKYPKDETTGITRINIAEIRRAETSAAGGKDPFRLDEAVELVKQGYMTQLDAKSNDEVMTSLKVDSFLHQYRLQRMVMAIQAINEQKRKGTYGK